MMLALAALFSSAFACGPYGNSIVSEEGSFAIDNGESISLYNADGSYAEVPVHGEIIDMDYVGEDLLVAFEDEDGSFALLFSPDGEDVAEWEPLRSNVSIHRVDVLEHGLLVTTATGKARNRVRLTDDLRRMRAPRAPFWGTR